jgi:hypothetical protein
VTLFPYTTLFRSAIQEQQGEIASLSNLFANLSIRGTEDLNITKGDSENYRLINNSNGSTITQIEALASLITANIKAGAIETTDFVAQNIQSGAVQTKDLATNSFTALQGTIDHLLVTSGLVSNSIQTAMISPIPGDSNVTVKIGSDATPSGKFAIENSAGSQVAAIDENGNATFSGTINSSDASISGTLYADNIKSKSLEDIQKLLSQVTVDQSLLLSATASANLTASSSANIAQLITNDLYVTNQAAINSLSIANSLTLGSDLVIGPGNTINSLSTPLKIQSLAMAPVEIMGGLVSIDTQGNMQIAGNLAVAGRIESSGLTLKDKETNPTSLLSLQDTNGAQVAGVDASGSANFNSVAASQFVIAAGADATNSAIVNGAITTNATAGTAQIPAGVSEIVINNSKVTDYTLIYVTPTSSTQNNVLYVKSKEPGHFTVGFTNPINTDTNFNWWIVQVQN